jgi:serine/threonine-protein kinase
MINVLLGGRYKIGEMIGTGGMADVYVAQDTRLARQVAVKVLRSDLARDPSFVARFRKEALAAAGLNHPGIVAVYDSGEEPAPYIVMELVSGHTLRELIHKGERVPLKRALEIGEGILAALEYSHHSGIVHRDIKPANIMITDHGDVKVMDFGIARALADLGATLTSTWNVVGTAQYLSPEQAVGEPADSRSDIYSTGCLLFELLTGQPPFTGETPVSIAYQHASSVAPLVRTLKPELPEGIETVLAVALSKKPEDVNLLDIVEAVDGPIRGQAPLSEENKKSPLDTKLQAICNAAADVTKASLKKAKISELTRR